MILDYTFLVVALASVGCQVVLWLDKSVSDLGPYYDVSAWGFTIIVLIVSNCCFQSRKPTQQRNKSLVMVGALSVLGCQTYFVALEFEVHNITRNSLLCEASSWFWTIAFTSITLSYLLRSTRLHSIFSFYPDEQLALTVESNVNEGAMYRESARSSFREKIRDARYAAAEYSPQPPHGTMGANMSHSMMFSPDDIGRGVYGRTPYDEGKHGRSSSALPPDSDNSLGTSVSHVRYHRRTSSPHGNGVNVRNPKNIQHSAYERVPEESPKNVTGPDLMDRLSSLMAESTPQRAKLKVTFSTARIAAYYMLGLTVICTAEAVLRTQNYVLFPFSQTPFCRSNPDKTELLSLVPFVCFGIGDMVLLLVDILLVWDVWSSFNPRAEFFWMLVPDILLLVAYYTSGVSDDTALDTHAVMRLKCGIFVLVSLVWPLTRAITYKPAPPPDLLDPECYRSIEGILSSLVTYDAYRNYLIETQDEVGIELLNFYVLVDYFQDSSNYTTSEELYDAAIRIYKEFLQPQQGSIGHFFSLLSSTCVADIGDILRRNDPTYIESFRNYGLGAPLDRTHIQRTLFDQLKEYVVNVLFRSEYFPRFRTSHIYKKLVLDARKAEALHRKMESEHSLTHSVSDNWTNTQQ